MAYHGESNWHGIGFVCSFDRASDSKPQKEFNLAMASRQAALWLCGNASLIVTFSTLCLQKSSHLYTLCDFSNLKRFPQLLHCWRAFEIGYKSIRHYPPHPRRVATLPREIKNSNLWPPVNCACVPQRFNSLLTPCFVKHFSGNSSVNLFAVYLSKHKLFYYNLVLFAEYHVDCCLVDKHCSDICCDEFSMPQIDRKSK